MKTFNKEEMEFAKLEERILKINNLNGSSIGELQTTVINNILGNKNPTLIIATGGSTVVAYYLQILLEQNNVISEVIEPRTFFYKQNLSCFENLIAISASGKTNGIAEALNNFSGNKYLITKESIKNSNFVVIPYSNKLFPNNERSFISLSSSFGPMALLLTIANNNITEQQINETNQKIKSSFKQIETEINNINTSFKEYNMFEIISGSDTKVSSALLESNLIEIGAGGVIIHDKGNYCHGRSNLKFNNSKNPIFYLKHNETNLDNTIIEVLKEEYNNIFVFNSFKEKDDLMWKEFYLSLKMLYLSKKIATDKNINLTKPEYNPKVVKKLYKYRGEM